MMNCTRFNGYPVVAYDLSAYESVLQPFCEHMLSDDGYNYRLIEDYAKDPINVWDLNLPEVKLMIAVFDNYCMEFLNEVHPEFKGLNKNYQLEKDGWLTTPQTKQHIRIHTHLPPFIRPEDVGSLISVFYVYIDETIDENNGPFEIFESEAGKAVHVWVPKTYNLLLMTPDVWHRARPFRGERYSLATDIKVHSY